METKTAQEQINEMIKESEERILTPEELKRIKELYEQQQLVNEITARFISSKPYVQSRKFDGDKLKYELVPVEVMEELAKILTYGAKKYAPNEWQKVEPFENRYYAALMRHLVEWRKGNHYDDESKLLHLSHAFCCMAFLLSREVEKQNVGN